MPDWSLQQSLIDPAVFLTSSKHIRLKSSNAPDRLTTFQRAIPQRRDEFLKRDRQLSLSQAPASEPHPAHRQTQIQTPKPRKDNAAHVSLPSDAIVKQQGQRQPAWSRSSPSRERIPLLRRSACKARPELEFHSLRQTFVRLDDRKTSDPASWQGGVSSRSPETHR